MAFRGTVDANAALAIDANALASLKAQAAKAPEQALGKAATQFEALFVSMVLKSMRDALPQDGIFSSETTKTYTTMFDQQLAVKLSERGIGLRKALEAQLARHLPKPPATTDAPASSPSTVSPRRDAPVGPGAPNKTPAPAPTSAAAHDGAMSAVESFIEKVRPHAEAAAKALGVPVQFVLAQAGLESGWGRSQPKTAGGTSSHNLFGIKAGRGWNGGVAPAKTTEYVQGLPIRSTDRFRAYGSYAESFQDLARLLKDNPRYASALAHGDDARRYASGLQRAGYATDPAYADKLTRAIALVTRHTRPPPATQVIAGDADTRTDRA